MHGFNDGIKQRKTTASHIMLSKRLTEFTTKIMIPYIYLLFILSSLDLIKECQCSQSANIATTSEAPNSNVQQEQSRKLHDVESITTFGNLISESIPMMINSQNEFQYYDDSLDSVMPTPRYDAVPPSIDLPSNHRPIHQLDMDHPYSPEVETVSFVSSDSYIPNIPNEYIVSQHNPTLVKVTREPIWAPEVLKLENQYIATFRSIKTSVMSIYTKMQDFFSYVMSFFSLENSPIGEARGKRKMKIKKKFKKFLLPLLIAYKLKFFALIPILIGGLVLLVGSTGMAGFFFALFAAVISLKGGH